MERQPVEERGGQALIAAEERRPLGEGHGRGDQQADLLVQRREEAEEQVGAGLGEGDEADLVEDQQLVAQQAALEAAEAVGGLRLEELVGEPGGGGEADAVPLLTGGDAEGVSSDNGIR